MKEDKKSTFERNLKIIFGIVMTLVMALISLMAYLESHKPDPLQVDESNVDAVTELFWDDKLDGEHTWNYGTPPIKERFKRIPWAEVRVLRVDLTADSSGAPKYQVVLLELLKDSSRRAEIYFPILRESTSLHRFDRSRGYMRTLFCAGDVGQLSYEKDRYSPRFELVLNEPKKAEME